MPLIQWSDRISVNVNEIDQQHKKLISLLNELHDSMKAGLGQKMLEKTLTELTTYTQTHFQTEEKYMQKFNYPEFEQHKKEHDKFVEKVKKSYEDIKSNRISLTITILKFLSDWITNHIQGTDKKYSQFFNDHGLK